MIEKKMTNIRLVEDDEVDVMNVKRAFKKNNITNPLYMASTGLEALPLLRVEAVVTLNKYWSISEML